MTTRSDQRSQTSAENGAATWRTQQTQYRCCPLMVILDNDPESTKKSVTATKNYTRSLWAMLNSTTKFHENSSRIVFSKTSRQSTDPKTYPLVASFRRLVEQGLTSHATQFRSPRFGGDNEMAKSSSVLPAGT